MSDPRTPARAVLHPLGAALVICLVGCLAYSDTLQHPFVFDDFHNIVDNPSIRLTRLDAGAVYEAAFGNPSARPVAYLSFALNYYLGDYQVAGYRGVNIAIHLVNGVLVYLLAAFLFAHRPRAVDPIRSWMPLFAALVFIAHPLQIQSVTYVVQRMNSLAVMFYLASLLLYIRGRTSAAPRRRWTLWGISLATWLLALGSKEIAATLPAIVLLLEWTFFRELSGASLRRDSKIALAVVIFLAAVTVAYLGQSPFEYISSGYERHDFTLRERLLTELRVVVFYISLCLFPHPSRLNLLHAFPVSHTLFDPVTTFLSLLALIGLVAAAILLVRRRPLVSFSVLWFLTHLVIESSVIPLFLIFEHRLYLPMVGIALLASDLLLSASLRWRSWAAPVSILLIASLVAATCVRNQTWRDRFTLWSDVIAKNPQSYIGQYNLADDLYERGELEQAIRHYRESLRIKPGLVEVHNNLGIALYDLGRPQEAIHHYMQVLRLKPDYPKVHNNLGLAMAHLGRLDEAMRYYAEAIRLDPDHAKARNNLGVTLARQDRLDEAIRRFEEALRIDPGYIEAQKNLAQALRLRDRPGAVLPPDPRQDLSPE